MLDILRRVPLFSALAAEYIQWIAAHVYEKHLASGEYLFLEGEPAEHFYVLLSGTLQISRFIGGREMVLTTHQDGAFTGEVPLLTDTPYIATARALGPCHLLTMELNDFRTLLRVCPPVMSTILSTMAKRMQMTESQLRERDKFMALEMLASGLAHELNNPAAAAHNAVEHLSVLFLELQTLERGLHAKHMSQVCWHVLDTIRQQTNVEIQSCALNALERSDREEELIAWLDSRGIATSWKLAPVFVRASLTLAQVQAYALSLPADLIADILTWLGVTLEIQQLIGEIEQSTQRISHLIKVFKEYSYLDQIPVQEIDIHQGIENTLTILGHKLTSGITIIREYDVTLPLIYASGNELNQVWTNLLDNALDALMGQGHIWIRTKQEGEALQVEIVDDGPGIPPEIQSRIFEPFFTTKDVGKGTGLGLDVVYRVVVGRHYGDIHVSSQPGETRFRIRLPLKPPERKNQERGASDDTP